MLFVIGREDITSNIIAGSYQINDEDAYEEWKNGWGVTHHDIYAKKCTGSFELLFRTTAEYMHFIEVMRTNQKQSGWYECRVATNNTGTITARNCFITFQPKRDRDGANRDYFGKFTVNVQEA